MVNIIFIFGTKGFGMYETLMYETLLNSFKIYYIIGIRLIDRGL